MMTVPGELSRARPHRIRPEPSEPGEEVSLLKEYLNQIAATPLLAATEEVELAKRIEAGVYANELLRQHDTGQRELPAENGERSVGDLIEDT